jgi:hypothetical protein
MTPGGPWSIIVAMRRRHFIWMLAGGAALAAMPALVVSSNGLAVCAPTPAQSASATQPATQPTPSATQPAGATPKLIPWLEVNKDDPRYVVPALEALRYWQRITDTAVIGIVPGSEALLARFAQAAPDMRIIPALKTHPLLRTEFSDPDRWQQVSREVTRLVELTGTRIILFEHESAVGDTLAGKTPLDLAGLQAGLRRLPPDVEYWWYPSLVYDGDENRRRSLEIVNAVRASLKSVRFTTLGFSDPKWRRYDPWWWRTLDEQGPPPPIPMLYFGCWRNCYWEPDQTPDALRAVAGRDIALVFVESSRWVECARIITRLAPPQSQPARDPNSS